MRTCSICKQQKNDDEFSKGCGRCRPCNRAYLRAYHQQRDDEKEYRQARQQAIKTKIAEVKANSQCLVCGEAEPCCLDFHHHEAQKEFNISRAYARNMGWERIEKELKKCVVLCSNCHRKIHNQVIELPKG